MDISDSSFLGRLGVQQRVLPAYRAEFFNMLGKHCKGGLSVFAGLPRKEENTTPATSLSSAQLVQARNLNFLRTTSPVYQCWQLGVTRWLREWQPDVLIVESNPRTPSTRMAVRWMHTHNRPVLGWGLGSPEMKGRFRAVREWTRYSFWNSLDGMIAYSQRGEDEYRQLGFPAERVFIARNAVSPRPGWKLPERPEGFSGNPRVLFVGRLQARKRIDNLLKACAALPVELSPRLSIVGDGPARADFESQAKQIFPAAEFTGALYGSDLESMFRESDLFVLPGSGGLAVQQAMSFGLPAIVAEGDGTQDDLVQPENGWLIPPDDLEALTSALVEAVQNPIELRRKGEAAFRMVVKEINLEAMVNAFCTAATAIQKLGTR